MDFAAEWSRQYEYDRIILLKSLYDSMFENIAVSAEWTHVNEELLNKERENAREQLQQLCRSLAARTGDAIKVMTAVSEMPVLRAVFEVIRNENPVLILAGSDNYDYSSDSYISGNVISIAKASPVNVLIVPATCRYQPVKEALLPLDFRLLDSIQKVNKLKTSAQWSDVQLQILHVDPKERYLLRDETLKQREANLHDYLKDFAHSIHYKNDKHIISGILKFAEEHPIQLIIALRGKHSFLYNLTHSSISEAIYRNASEPVLILK